MVKSERACDRLSERPYERPNADCFAHNLATFVMLSVCANNMCHKSLTYCLKLNAKHITPFFKIQQAGEISK